MAQVNETRGSDVEPQKNALRIAYLYILSDCDACAFFVGAEIKRILAFAIEASGRSMGNATR